MIPITNEEIVKTIKKFKKSKSPGSDMILNEYFIFSCDIIADRISRLFNFILDSGTFPDKSSEGLIIPVFKKGNACDPQNYRGITLLSCFSKLFSAVLTNRLNVWIESNNKVSDAHLVLKKIIQQLMQSSYFKL